MQNVLFIFFLPLWVFLSSSNVTASDFQAKVIHIADGDTIIVLNDTNEGIVNLTWVWQTGLHEKANTQLPPSSFSL